MSTRDVLIQKIEKQPDWILKEVDLFLDFLASRQAHADPSPESLGWPSGYFEETTGSFADEPLDRPQQLPYEKREEW